MGIEPLHTHLQCDALPVDLPSPWEQGGGERGYTSASSWCPLTSFMEHPWVAMN